MAAASSSPLRPPLMQDTWGHIGSVDWQTVLWNAGAENLLSRCPELAKMGRELGFWFYKLDNIMSTTLLRTLSQELLQVFIQWEESLGKKRKTESAEGFKYRTLSASHYPCACSDLYGGLSEKHTIFQWGRAASGVTDPPPPGMTVAPRGLERVLENLSQALLQRVGLKDPTHSCLQCYAITNWYKGDTQIGCHTDDSALYGATEPPGATIFSFSAYTRTMSSESVPASTEPVQQVTAASHIVRGRNIISPPRSVVSSQPTRQII